MSSQVRCVVRALGNPLSRSYNKGKQRSALPGNGHALLRLAESVPRTAPSTITRRLWLIGLVNCLKCHFFKPLFKQSIIVQNPRLPRSTFTWYK